MLSIDRVAYPLASTIKQFLQIRLGGWRTSRNTMHSESILLRHELAGRCARPRFARAGHSWFGNSSRAAWAELWLNEVFPSYMERSIANTLWAAKMISKTVGYVSS